MPITYAHSDFLDRFLALQRELSGRFGWETGLLPRPVTPAVHTFTTGVRRWRRAGLSDLPHWLTDPDGRPPADPEVERGTTEVLTALAEAGPVLRAALEPWPGLRERAVAELGRLLPFDRIAGELTEAIGADVTAGPPVYLVPFAPNPPAAGFLSAGTRPSAIYVDFRRYTGSTLAESVLTMTAWAALRTATGEQTLPAQLLRLLPGGGRYHRRLRALLTKVLVEITAGEHVRRVVPGHRPCVDVLGTAWRYPRLFRVAEVHWNAYLAGHVERQDALAAIAADVRQRSPHWFVDHVDAASLAADFYLLEWLTSAADRPAEVRLHQWLPHLARDFAEHLDLIVGAELGHYERTGDTPVDSALGDFLRTIRAQDSRVSWAQERARLGQATALRLAHRAFAGPGREFGGEAWAPVAAMLARYARHELPHRVFIDQCFTLQHNNGSLFDKFHDTSRMRTVLDAQAAGDLFTLAEHASPEVRARWHGHLRTALSDRDPVWLGATPLEVDLPAGGDPATPGAAGCGSAEDPASLRAGWDAGAEAEIRVRQPIYRRPLPATLDRYDRVTARLHTDLGVVELELLPDRTPYTVDNFVRLARGTAAWVDPLTGRPGTGPFYDGTVFHRRLPGFLVQAGDRTGTGHGGPGYRLPEEIRPDLPFDRPFLVGMANLGTDLTGSQFFVTLAAADHLTGKFTRFGEVVDELSRKVVTEIAHAPHDVVLHQVEVSVQEKSS